MEIRLLASRMWEYPLGLTPTPAGMVIKVFRNCENLSLKLFQRNEKEAWDSCPFPLESRVGDCWAMEVLISKGEKKNLEYALEDEKGEFPDPYGKTFSGQDSWGKESLWNKPRRSPVYIREFDWEGDIPVELDLRKSVIYRVHVRGFTKSASSRAVQKGTFHGIVEKIPYLKSLGIDAVDLMPCAEFEELEKTAPSWSSLFHSSEAAFRMNYWGYKKALQFAPKASYCTKRSRDPVREYQSMAKALHQAGIALIQEFFFTPDMQISYVLEVLRYWKLMFHVDGFHITGIPSSREILADPLLKGSKMLFSNGCDSPSPQGLGLDYSFMNQLRRFLKGDEGMLPAIADYLGAEGKAVHFAADINGFSLADVFAYNYKHNEDNGEENQDGESVNYSWNCGAEGETKKKNILLLRKKMFRNALLLLLLTPGCVLICSGDEFGQTRQGNNNAYCQDNEISWLDWKNLTKNEDRLEFFKGMVQLRKQLLPALYREKEAGEEKFHPPLSLHGTMAWQPELDYHRHELALLLERERSYYIMYNMHWEAHEFLLPTLKKGVLWRIMVDTDAPAAIAGAGEEMPLENQRQILLAPRSAVVLVSSSGL